MNEAPHRCVFCRRPVNGPQDGVAFGAAGRFLFTTCHEHAPMVRAGAKTVMQTVAAGLNTLIDRKMPTLGKILREVRTARKELEA